MEGKVDVELIFKDAGENISGDLKVLLFQNLLQRACTFLSATTRAKVDDSLNKGLNSSAIFLLTAYQKCLEDEQPILAKIIDEEVAVITELAKVLCSIWKGGQWLNVLVLNHPW